MALPLRFPKACPLSKEPDHRFVPIQVQRLRADRIDVTINLIHRGREIIIPVVNEVIYRRLLAGRSRLFRLRKATLAPLSPPSASGKLERCNSPMTKSPVSRRMSGLRS